MRISVFILLLFLSSGLKSQENITPTTNEMVIETVIKHGPSISPTYQKAVCTELVIKVLEHFCTLTTTDKSRIRIIVKEDIYQLIKVNSPLPKGVYYALTEKKIGLPIDDFNQVIAGDFVQFWYPNSWGHCGIVHSIDVANKTMKLYSSFPSTDGYGIQPFDIPDYCFFVRLTLK